jgi:hypothetical protein
MPWMLLAKMEDDTGFIITLGVVLLAVICWLVLGQDQTIRLQDVEEAAPDTDEFRQKLLQRLDRTNDLLTSIRNSALIFIVLIVIVPILLLLFTEGCKRPENTAPENKSAHVWNTPNTYNH